VVSTVAADDERFTGVEVSPGRRRVRRSLLAVRLLSSVTVVCVASFVAVVAVTSPAVAAPAVPSVGAESGALRHAAVTGDRVEVTAERTDVSQVFAEPDGRLTLEVGAVPQWVRGPDGSWRDIDSNLTPGADGLLRPVASPADVAFSPDGTGPLVSLVRAGHRMTLSCPHCDLRDHSVDGDSVTYTDALPGADLVLRATPTGFSHVLVVKTPAAAASDAVKHLKFTLGGDVHVERLADGSLQAVAGDTTVASAGAPSMWDSSGSGSGSAFGASVRRAAVAGDASTASEPGDGAQVAPVGTAVAGDGVLTLSPDPALLTSRSATFPLYIDPSWDPGKNRWAYATSNNSNNTDTSVARVGADPDSGKKYRSFFEFKIGTVAKSHIESAYVHMGLHHSWSCDSTPVFLYQSGTISATPRSPWSTKLVKALGSVSAHAHKSTTGTCENDPQPDADVNFRDGSITTLIGTLATGSAATVTFGFCACSKSDGTGESDTHRWKKFTPGAAKLVIDYDHAPGTPTSLQVGLPSSGVGCGKTVGTVTPELYASFPDADKGQTITGSWQWGTYTNSAEAAPGNVKTLKATSATAGTATWNASALPALAKNATYGFRVMATDPSPYSQTSSWSGWCKFTVDTSVPNVTATVLTAPAGPGKPGSFRIDSTSTDVGKFSYGFTDGVTKDVKPTAVAGGFTATVPVTATDYGTNTLHVKAIDTALNEGNFETSFDVPAPSPPVARWGLESTPRITQSGALADEKPDAAGDTPLTATGLTWADGARLNDAQTARFDGATSRALASGPVVDTTKSFSAAAWVRPDSMTVPNQTFIGKDAGAGQWGSFRVQLRGDTAPTWCMLMSSIATKSDNVSACLPASTRAGVWTHVGGVYDAASGTIRVYVDGVGSAPTVVTSPQNSSGPIAVGRGFNNGAGGEWFHGGIADVQIFDRVLVAEDFTGHTAGDDEAPSAASPGMFEPVAVGEWTFDGVRHCPSDGSPYCAVKDLSPWQRRTMLTPGAEGIEEGNRGGALQLDGSDGPVDDDNPNPPATTEYGRTQLSDTPTADDATWRDAPVLVTDQSFTASVWVAPDDTTATMTAVGQGGGQRAAFALGLRSYQTADATEERWSFTLSASDSSVAAVADARSADVVTDDLEGSWTHLVGVYDATKAQLTLYVNGELAGAATVGAAWNAAGPLSVGADRTASGYGDLWFGDIDDLDVFQGNMTAAQVAQLYDAQRQPDDAA
jgi:Concanavalin A-like lectin/glucanases superfamily